MIMTSWFARPPFRVAFASVLAVTVGLAACSDDDGGDVRDGTGSESGSPSGTGSESGSPSGTSGGSPPGVTGCEATGDASGADTTINVTVREFAVEASVDTITAGTIQMVVENTGTLTHEVLVVRADDPDDLPRADGHLDEDALGDDFIGEIEGISRADVCDGTFTLEAGTYQLLCAIVDDDGVDHLAEGMVTQLVVE